MSIFSSGSDNVINNEDKNKLNLPNNKNSNNKHEHIKG